MLNFMMITFAHILLQVFACPEPITTVHIQNHDGPIYVSPSDRLPCDNQITIGSHGTCNRSTCSQGTCNQGTCTQGTCNQGTCNQGNCNQVICNQGTCNQGTCYHPCIKIDSLLHHNSPYHLCETDCKCVTKQLSTSVPINTVPQNTCTPGTYYSYPDYSSYYYPESQYGAGVCPIAAEGIIPLLKSYLGQGKCPKQGCQCVQSY